MQRTIQVDIADIYVPAKRRKTLDAARVESLAEAILEEGMTTPIMVRADKARWVLVEGLHRLEALRALGETRIAAFRVQPRQH
jgi:ParB-like chromosome segregation protein Spo0J